jgi:hypothetical protein
VQPCVSVAHTAWHLGLLACRQARRGVELPIARCQSVGRGLVLVVSPSKLAVDQGGTPFLVQVP